MSNATQPHQPIEPAQTVAPTSSSPAVAAVPQSSAAAAMAANRGLLITAICITGAILLVAASAVGAFAGIGIASVVGGSGGKPGIGRGPGGGPMGSFGRNDQSAPQDRQQQQQVDPAQPGFDNGSGPLYMLMDPNQSSGDSGDLGDLPGLSSDDGQEQSQSLDSAAGSQTGA